MQIQLHINDSKGKFTGSVTVIRIPEIIEIQDFAGAGLPCSFSDDFFYLEGLQNFPKNRVKPSSKDTGEKREILQKGLDSVFQEDLAEHFFYFYRRHCYPTLAQDVIETHYWNAARLVNYLVKRGWECTRIAPALSENYGRLTAEDLEGAIALTQEAKL